jgi:hypothetical protein
MKKSVIPFLLVIVLASLVSSAPCELGVSMINQDPYPAIQGDYVKLVFQISGIENPECQDVKFRVIEKFPFSLDPNATNEISIKSGVFVRTYSSDYLAVYKIRVSEDAMDGDNPIEVFYSDKNAEFLKQFNVHLDDTSADFEIHVKNYDYMTQEITFEILNIADVDVQALTLEIPKQENVQIKGANKKVVGDLDSNEYTTSTFEAIPKDGNMEIKIIYTDSINTRREIVKNVTFDSSYFKDSNGNKKSQPYWLYVVIFLLIGWFVWSRIRKYQMRKKLMHRH